MRYWFDTEFIERGPYHPLRLLSIGIVADDGREFYYESPFALMSIDYDFKQYGDPWLTENVRPHLAEPILIDTLDGVAERRKLEAQIIEFCDPARYGKPEFWAYYADYDWVVLCQIFGRMIDLPKGWPMYCRDLKQLADMFPIVGQLPKQDLEDETPEHHALNDARWTKRAWEYAAAVLDDVHPLDLSYRL